MNTEARKNVSANASATNISGNIGSTSTFTIEDLFNRNVHYGHVKNLWNPKMAPYIHGVKNNVHIINLVKSFEALSSAKNELYKAGLEDKRILFVGTKPQISKLVKKYAIECGQYYVNQKWLGGMLTNWKAINSLVKTLNKYEKQVREHSAEYTKKELMLLAKQIEKLEKAIGGIKDLPTKPDIIFVIDTEIEKMAITEANKMGIRVIAIVDTNSNPEGVDLVIPGNDDSIKAIEFYLQQASEAILEGTGKALLSSSAMQPAKNSKPTGNQKSFGSGIINNLKPKPKAEAKPKAETETSIEEKN